MTEVMSMQKVKVRSQRSRSQRSQPNLPVSGLQFEFTFDDEMRQIAWCCLKDVPYCFSRSSVKFQGYTTLKIVKFDPDWAFPDCNSSLNSLMDLKWYTTLDVILKTGIIFRVHPSNCKVTRAENGRFESNLCKITRPVAAIKSLRFALFCDESRYGPCILWHDNSMGCTPRGPFLNFE